MYWCVGLPLRCPGGKYEVVDSDRATMATASNRSLPSLTFKTLTTDISSPTSIALTREFEGHPKPFSVGRTCDQCHCQFRCATFRSTDLVCPTPSSVFCFFFSRDFYPQSLFLYFCLHLHLHLHLHLYVLYMITLTVRNHSSRLKTLFRLSSCRL